MLVGYLYPNGLGISVIFYSFLLQILDKKDKHAHVRLCCLVPFVRLLQPDARPSMNAITLARSLNREPPS